MSTKRSQIVDCARTYLNTPFGDKGRVKGKALDCVGLPLMIAEELGLVDIAGEKLHGHTYCSYSSQPSGTIVLDLCIKHLVRKGLSKIQPGDVLVMVVPTQPCHVGIFAGEVDGVPSLIHAYSGGPNKCVEQPIDVRWSRRIVAAFSFPGVE